MRLLGRGRRLRAGWTGPATAGIRRRWAIAALTTLALGGVALGTIATHEAARASAVLNALALVTAVLVGSAAYRASAKQLRQARIATYLAHRPVLVPVHQTPGMLIPPGERVGPDGTADAWFPVRGQYKLAPDAPPSDRVFQVSARAGEFDAPRAAIYIRNVGAGPAFVSALRVASMASQAGVITGRRAIGVGEYEQFIVELTATAAATAQVADDLPPSLVDLPPARLFALQVDYEDVFETGRQYTMRAWFDPRERGAWITAERS